MNLIITTILLLNAAWGEIHSEIVFNPQDGGLPWPLPDATDSGLLTMHGAHCLEQLSNNRTNASMDVMHHEHCQNVIAQILRFLFEKKYHVDTWICSSLVSPRVRRRIRFGNYNYNWFSYIKRRKRSAGEEHYQDDKYIKLASTNFGYLLMKNWTNPALLSAQEATYLQQWENSDAISAGAVGVYCASRGNLSAVQESLHS